MLTSAFSSTKKLIGVISNKLIIENKLQSVDIYLNFSCEVSFFSGVGGDVATRILTRATEVK